jgi:translocation and assembly module TamA
MSAGAAWARTADILLTVRGDQHMAEELETLLDALDRESPLEGDGLSLLQGAQARQSRLARALRSRGFYDGEVMATFEGRPIDEPAALDAIAARPENDRLRFDFAVDTGVRFKVASLTIRAAGAPERSLPIDLDRLGLAVGQPADAAAILASEQQALRQLRERGHALARARPREVIVDRATKEAEVTYVIEEGPSARMGPVTFTGSDKVDTAFLQRRVPYEMGEPYTPDKLDRLRGRMTSLGVFNSVRIKSAEALDAEGRLPIEVELRDRPARAIGFGVAYETQLGFAVNGYWLHRNLFGEAESLRLAAEVNRIGQGKLFDDFGYALKADFRKPSWWLSNQDAFAQAQVAREVFNAYRRKGVILTAGLDRVFSRHWRGSAGLTGDFSEVETEGSTRSFALIGLPLSVTLDKADSVAEPTRGFRTTLTATPYVDMKNRDDIFANLRLTGSAYLDVSGDGRSVLAGRLSFGTIPGTSTSQIPRDKLFYAGGGGSVRGFAYQSAGPRDASNRPVGGASVVEASVEFRQRIGKAFGAVAFLDAGSAYPDTWPDFSLFAPRFGAGVGVRYYTDFGPARLDVGVPLNRRDGDVPFGIYVSIGQAF